MDNNSLDDNATPADLDVTLIENPPRKKRGRVNSLTLINDTNNSLLIALEAMECRLTSRIDHLQTSLDTRINTLATRLDTKIKKVEDDLSSKIVSLSMVVDEKLMDKATVSSVAILNKDFMILQEKQKQSESTIDKIEREYLLDRLIISNIPYVENENLVEIYDKISKAIGSQSKIVSAHRLKIKETFSKQLKSGNASTHNEETTHASNSTQQLASLKIKYPPILVKFYSAEQRFEFFHKYFSFKNLNLEHIGFNSTTRIYINEQLTRKNTEILRTIQKLKDRNIVSRYYTSRGVVYACKNNDKLKSFAILNLEETLKLEH